MELTLGILQALGICLVAPAALGCGIVGLLTWWGRRSELVVCPQGDELNLKRRTLKEVDVLRGLSDEQIDNVASYARMSRAAAGELLAKAGELGEQLFIIIQGEAQLSAQSALGEITVRIAGHGESFPLAALVGSGILITSAKALTDMELLAIPRPGLLALCSQNPEIGLRIYANTANVFANRYIQTLAHLTFIVERATKDADFLANI